MTRKVNYGDEEMDWIGRLTDGDHVIGLAYTALVISHSFPPPFDINLFSNFIYHLSILCTHTPTHPHTQTLFASFLGFSYFSFTFSVIFCVPIKQKNNGWVEIVIEPHVSPSPLFYLFILLCFGSSFVFVYICLSLSLPINFVFLTPPFRYACFALNCARSLS